MNNAAGAKVSRVEARHRARCARSDDARETAERAGFFVVVDGGGDWYVVHEKTAGYGTEEQAWEAAANLAWKETRS